MYPPVQVHFERSCIRAWYIILEQIRTWWVSTPNCPWLQQTKSVSPLQLCTEAALCLHGYKLTVSVPRTNTGRQTGRHDNVSFLCLTSLWSVTSWLPRWYPPSRFVDLLNTYMVRRVSSLVHRNNPGVSHECGRSEFESNSCSVPVRPYVGRSSATSGWTWVSPGQNPGSPTRMPLYKWSTLSTA